ncbi:MAG: ABC transporter permease [Cytophagales bacterium]|nr:ABC transporter permease [Cytophagales bacterium]
MKSDKNIPPKLARRFLDWFLRYDLAEEVAGDLEEQFFANLGKSTLFRSRLNYWYQVINYLRPFAISKSTQISSTAMFRNYFKIGIRNIMKVKTVSFINITGLGVGLACCFFILLYVKDELSYDSYHKNLEQIYRVLHTYRHTDTPGSLPPPTPEEFQVWGSAPVGPALLEDFPEIQSFFRFTSPLSLLFQYGDRRFQEDNMVFADSTAFEIFSWKLYSGNAKTALRDPNSIVITESIALKYFGSENPLGKSISIGQYGSLMVTGVMEDVPVNSHFNFDGLISMTTFYAVRPNIFDYWGYVDFYTYFLVNENTDIENLKSKIPDFIHRHQPEWKDNTIAFEALSDAYLYSKAGRQPGTTGSLSNIYIFSVIAIFILLIACINFMNLSTARSIERSKEVGIRKVSGAFKHALISQFLVESILLTSLSTLFAAVLILITYPVVQEISGKLLPFGSMLSWQYIPYFFIGIVCIGILAGSYPAWVLSGFRPVKVLKGSFKSTSRGISLRKGLVVLQFSLSMALIVGTTVVYLQLDFLKSHDLGFVREQTLVIDFGWDNEVQNQVETIKNELLNHPAVQSVTASRAVPGNSFPNAYTGIESPQGEFIFNGPAIYEIDMDFVPNYEIEMAAGRGFSKDFNTDSTQALLVNEAAARLYGYANSEELIGKNFSQWGREGKVIGVVKDFNYKSLHQEVEPLTLRIAPVSALRNLSLRIQSSDMSTTVTELERLWNQLAPQRPFLYSFLDDSFNRQYQADVRFRQIFSIFAGLAILIACLGLFGLSVYTAERRTKEIGIRKALGASVASIISLLSKDFIVLFILAIVIATPGSWYIMNNWLNKFAYRIGIGIEIFLFSGIIAIAVAITTISWQSIKAARKNPVGALRNE